jgi:hypothetical protein
VRVGDLVKLKNQGNGQPGVGIIYERTPGQYLGPGRGDEFKCLWDNPHWNHSFYFERELEVISEEG